jgi:hypothetical protein
MKYFLYCLVVVSLLTDVLHAQPRQFSLKGYLGVQGGESFEYLLEFSDSSGIIKGHSLTWKEKGKEVKAVISGSVDRKERRLSFREDQLLYNSGFYSNATICLIDATLRCRAEAGGVVLSGPITSADAGNVYCGKGSVIFTDKETIERLFADVAAAETVAAPPKPKPVAKREPMKIVYDTASKAPATAASAPGALARITSGHEKELEWHSDSVIVYVWDGGHIDEDIVTLSANGVAVLSRYKLEAGKRRLSFPIAESEIFTISITANNEGNEPPNTANLQLVDGDKSHPLIAYNTIGKEAVVRIHRVSR